MGREGLLAVVNSSCYSLSPEDSGKIHFRFECFVVCFFLFSEWKSVFCLLPLFYQNCSPKLNFSMYGFKCNCSCFRACWFEVQQGTVRFFQRFRDITKASPVLQSIVEQSRKIQFLIARGKVTAAGIPQVEVSSWVTPACPQPWKADINLQGGVSCPPTVGQFPAGPGSLDSPSTCPSWVPLSQGPWGLALELCRPGPPLLTWA